MKKLPKGLRAILKKISRLKDFTDFEKKVYRTVLKIPNGSVHSYEWVAEKINRPQASRAVGNALNKNPLSPLVPCHRVIKKDGSPGGFSKGAALKKKLLAREGVRL